jgi:hypothetical protein
MLFELEQLKERNFLHHRHLRLVAQAIRFCVIVLCIVSRIVLGWQVSRLPSETLTYDKRMVLPMLHLHLRASILHP